MEAAGHGEIVHFPIRIRESGGAGVEIVEFEAVGPIQREDREVELARCHLRDVPVHVHLEGVVRHGCHGKKLGGPQSREGLPQVPLDEHVERAVVNETARINAYGYTEEKDKCYFHGNQDSR